MADVLGKYSFLDTPDVNGALVLTEGTAVGSITGTTNQIDITGPTSARVASISANPVIPGTASLTLPSGTTAERPVSPVAGMVRYNTTIGTEEFYNGVGWVASGTIIQTVIGNIPIASTNVIIPYDNTLPTSTEGAQIWSQSFTPISASSIIVVSTIGFYTVNNAADIYTIVATFNGTTCFGAGIAGWTTNANDGTNFNIVATQTAGSTAARTYSARIGPNVAQTVFVNQQAGGGALFGGTANIGRYIIQEITP